MFFMLDAILLLSKHFSTSILAMKVGSRRIVHFGVLFKPDSTWVRFNATSSWTLVGFFTMCLFMKRQSVVIPKGFLTDLALMGC